MLLKQALQEINRCTKEASRRFSIDFITLDVNRKQGGRLKTLRNCMVTKANHDEKLHGTITVLEDKKNAHPIPVHIRLIQRLNNEFVDG